MPLETFTILTTDPNELMAPVHNRMPVILEPRNYSRWLDPGDPATPPLDLLRPFPAEKMEAWPVSNRVGNVRNNEIDLLSGSPPTYSPRETIAPPKNSLDKNLRRRFPCFNPYRVCSASPMSRFLQGVLGLAWAWNPDLNRAST